MDKSYWQIQIELEEGRYRAMANAFLSRKLPKDFAPDGGIEFKAPADEMNWPIGTNLFTFEQALKMFKECMPPSCFGLDDCSTQSMMSCSWVDKCGVDEHGK